MLGQLPIYRTVRRSQIAHKSKAIGFNSPQYTAQLIRGIITMAETLWNLRRRDEHDIAMAENAHWLIDHVYQGKKVIIWGHYIHLNRQELRYADQSFCLD